MLISEELILTWQGREMEGQIRGHPARQRQPAKGGAKGAALCGVLDVLLAPPMAGRRDLGPKVYGGETGGGSVQMGYGPEKNGVLILKIMIGTGVYPKRMAFELGNMRFETSGSSRCIQIPHFRTNPCESHVPGCC